jgi:hypothetical protein
MDNEKNRSNDVGEPTIKNLSHPSSVRISASGQTMATVRMISANVSLTLHVLGGFILSPSPVPR